ncbi:hypothetical protein HYC85_007828 [Camellia sinensis]|uniref:Uncharacterized protein n=1 Tax=Camellia sinensis TaxID=4442 RepID=A0A7J7HQ17_CAMSI|nr:hypothetical protein HYC85_007828 [Camellia sinensis]
MPTNSRMRFSSDNMTINLIFVHHMQHQHHYELMQVMILEKTSMPPLDMLAKRVKTTARDQISITEFCCMAKELGHRLSNNFYSKVSGYGGMELLKSDANVLMLDTYVDENKVINVYIEHNLDDYVSIQSSQVGSSVETSKGKRVMLDVELEEDEDSDAYDPDQSDSSSDESEKYNDSDYE